VSDGSHRHAHCLNCGAELGGRYCARCGQKDSHLATSLRELLYEASRDFLDWDGRVVGTLRVLLSKPGELTAEFLRGRRASYLAPLRLYLICSIAYFGLQPVVEWAAGSPAAGRGVSVVDPETRAAIDSLPAPALVREQLLRAAAEPAGFAHDVALSIPRAMFVLVPVFALLTRLVYRKAEPNYLPHLYYAMHVFAATFAVQAVALLPALTRIPGIGLVSGLATLGYLCWYAVASLQRVYGGTARQAFWSATIIGVGYLFAYVIAIAGVIAVSVLLV